MQIINSILEDFKMLKLTVEIFEVLSLEFSKQPYYMIKYCP